LTRSAQWIPPNISLGEGPIKHRPYCTEAVSSNTRIQVEYEEEAHATTATATATSTAVGGTTNINTNTSKNNTTRLVIQLELLTVEYGLDVELPTLQTRTTQETIALYLGREKRTRQSLSRSSSHDTKEDYGNNNNNKNEDEDEEDDDDSVCIVNTGVHDPKLYPYMTPQLFATNVERYLRLIHPHCGTLIWLGIAAVSNRPRLRRQRNEILVLMDDEVNRWLDRYYNTNQTRPILRIDVWNKSLTSPHKDHVHLSPQHYYTPLASLMATFLRPPLV
jgi:hypothetical protein